MLNTDLAEFKMFDLKPENSSIVSDILLSIRQPFELSKAFKFSV